MKSSLGDKQQLLHILEAISETETSTKNIDFETFRNNSMMRFATIKQIEIVGEAANCITEDTKNTFTTINWRQMIGMRNILVHEYFGVYNNVVWQVITDDIPKLKTAVQQIVRSFDE